MVGIFFVNVSVLETVKIDTYFNNDSDCNGIVLHRSEEDLSAMSRDAKCILYDASNLWNLLLKN